MLGHRELSVDDYLAILRRRWPLIAIPALLGSLAAYAVALKMPHRYISRTLVLVEQQKVPDTFVRPMITEDLNQRLASMQEQILSRARLQPIIERFGLFREAQSRMATEDLVAQLRKNISVEPVRPIPGTRPEELPGFYINVTWNDAWLAQQICAEVTSMFMDENLRLRQQRAQGTTEFLEKQLLEAKQKLDEQDARLAVFKGRYIGQLPGEEQTNLNLLMGLTTQLEAVTQALNRAQHDKTFAESMLVQQVAAWKASQEGTNPETLEQQLTSLQNQLMMLEAHYTADHPDVIKVKSDVAQLKRKLSEANASSKDKPVEKTLRVTTTEPPEIQKLRSQIHQYEITIQERSREQEQLQQQTKVYQTRVRLSPMVEQQYKEITRDYQTALDFYNDLLKKMNQSEMASDLERRQQGEQFRVLDPPNLPERPSFPNRPQFAAGGLGGGLALGLALTLLLEMRDKALRTERDIEFFLELPTLGLVPIIGQKNSKRRGFWHRAKTEKTSLIPRTTV